VPCGKRLAAVCAGVKGPIGLAVLAPAFVLLLWGSAELMGSDDSEPPVRVPSNVAWTAETIARAYSGNALRGLLIARRCDRCHGYEGFSSNPAVPNLAAMDRLVVWKQLDDFRSGKRNSHVMQPIANSLSWQDSADVAAYYWLMPIFPDPRDERAFPQPLSDPRLEAVAVRLITTGDGSRGLPPCQACHGSIGWVTGAPSLATQNATYLLEQIEAFATGQRRNDINMRMRSIAVQLTEDERHALAESYGAGLDPNSGLAGR
jgi:cytochrome c553